MKRRDFLPFPSGSLFWCLPQAPCARLERGPSVSGRIQLQAGGDAGPVGVSEGPGGGMPGRACWAGGCQAGDMLWLQVSLGAKYSLQGCWGWGSLLQRMPPARLGPGALCRKIGAVMVPCPLSCHLFALFCMFQVKFITKML